MRAGPQEPPAQRRLQLNDQRGVVAIEFALILPFMLIVVFLLTDFGRMFNYLNDANQIAANGARMAAVDTYPGSATLREQGDTAELRSITGGSHLPGGMSICVDFPTGTGTVGNPVRVRTTGNFKLVKILGGVSIPITGEATMRLERTPTFAAGC